MSRQPHFLTPLLVYGDARCVLHNDRTGEVVADHIELAGDSKTRTRGLLGRQGLDPGRVLVIAPCNSVHTFFMRFTIDVAFANRDGRVVKLCPNLQPWRIGVALGAFAALEFSAGTAARIGLVPGDRFVFKPLISMDLQATSNA